MPQVVREENVMKPGEWIRSFLLGSRSWEQFSMLLARISLGVFFAISGGNKLFVASRTRQMYETLARAGIPLPHFMTYLVSSIEFIGGCLLVIGTLTVWGLTRREAVLCRWFRPPAHLFLVSRPLGHNTGAHLDV